MLTEIRSTFDRLVAEGREAADAGRTFEYRCARCGTVTYHSREGGQLNEGTCEPRCSGDDLNAYVMLAGEREHLGTLNGVMGVVA
jgi:hypothetical protein